MFYQTCFHRGKHKHLAFINMHIRLYSMNFSVTWKYILIYVGFQQEHAKQILRQSENLHFWKMYSFKICIVKRSRDITIIINRLLDIWYNIRYSRSNILREVHDLDIDFNCLYWFFILDTLSQLISRIK